MNDEPTSLRSPKPRQISSKTCEVCGRSFTRSEHLIRHRRTHSSERPFNCPFCDANFPRADVRENHVKRFHGVEGLRSSGAKRANPESRERSKLACDQCRRGKLRCDNHHPCQACQNKGIDCTVSSSSRRPGRPRIHRATNRLVGNAPVLDTSVLDYCNAFDVSDIPPVESDHSVTTAGDMILSGPSESNRPPIQVSVEQSQFLGVARPVDSMGAAANLITLQEDITATAFDVIFPTEGDIFMDGMGSMSDGLVDMDFNDPLWQLPIDVSDWLDHLEDMAPGDLGPGNFFPDLNTGPSLDVSNMNNATTMMLEYSSRRSRASSPAKEVARRMGSSSRPRLQKYDKEVINILLNIGRAHVSTSFPIFSNFEATNETSQALCLAMAAIGALYSTAQGGTTIAKSLFNDARILQNESFFRHCSPTFVAATNSAETFLLLEIYAICSGNRRACEFLEAFHFTTLEAFKSCWQMASVKDNLSERDKLRGLAESLHVLDSYRVLLILRPPCFLLFDELTMDTAQAMLDDQRTSMVGLASILTPAEPTSGSSATLQNLAYLSAAVWMSGPRGQETSPRAQPWKPEFIELGLERWMCARSQGHQDADLSQLLLYHLAYINLYANVSLLQRYAHRFLDQSTRMTEDKNFDGIRGWVNGHHYTVARWHADAMLRLIKTKVCAPYRRHQPHIHETPFLEPPHLSYCIYFGTLVVLYGPSTTKSPTVPRNTPIDTARKLLGRLQAPASKIISTSLRELLVDGSEGYSPAI